MRMKKAETWKFSMFFVTIWKRFETNTAGYGSISDSLQVNGKVY